MDAPIVPVSAGMNALPYCFTLQSCYGHFVHTGQRDPRNVDPLPQPAADLRVKYRLAYIALCIDKGSGGGWFMENLKEIPDIDPGYIQFGCAGWFRAQQVNSFVLQVEPQRFKHRDSATLDYREALHVEKVRNEFYARVGDLLNIKPPG